MNMRPTGFRAAFAATAALTIAVVTLPSISAGLGSLVSDTPGLSSLATSSVGAAVSDPPLTCSAPTIYNVNSSGNFYALNFNTLANTPATPPTIGTGEVNTLGVSANGTTAFSGDQNVVGGTTTISVENITTGTRTSFPGMAASGAAIIIAGGVDPVNGNYYYGGWNGAENQFFLFVFNPATDTSSAVGTITPPSGLAYDYGDIAFDGSGNLTMLAGSTTNSAKLLTVTAAAVAAGGATPFTTLATITATQTEQYVGIAYAANSTLYVETAQAELYSVNPNNGTITDLGLQSGITGTPTDLASCTFNGSLTAQKNIVGRVAPGDQFTLTITGGGITSGNTGTTTGSSTGLQTGTGEVAGPVVGMPGTAYTVTETAAAGSGANLANYQATYSCVDGATTVSSGTGTSTTFSFPSASASSGAQVVCTFTNTPASLSIVKATSTTSYSAVGDTISYTYTVTNTGPLTLTGVGVTDLPVPPAGALTTGPSCEALASPSGPCSGNSVTLVPGQVATFAGSYTVAQADLDNRSVSDTSSATGTAPGGGSVTSTSNEVTVDANQNPAISLDKTAVAPGLGNTYSAPGQTIDYSYLVTNTGNVTLTSVNVTDPMTGLSDISCPDTMLAPAASETCTATYTTTQLDVDNGSINNTGTATGTGGGKTVTATSSATVDAVQTPGISLHKTAVAPGPGNTYSAPGQTIDYSYLVTNTGNVTLTSVNVTDPMTGLSDISCPDTTLAPAASETCTATYTTTQLDVDNGSINNTGTATGTGGGKTVTATSSATVSAGQNPSISILKSAAAPGSGNTYNAPGQTIDYSYLVTNTGNVTLTSVTVTDPMTGLSGISCPSSTLAVGHSEICTATYKTTQADVDNGSVNNTGTAFGTGGGKTVTATSSATVSAVQSPSIALVKTARAPGPGNTYNAPGQTITYSFKVTNTGNVTLTAVKVIDKKLTGLSAINCPSSTLAPSASETCTATYKTTQADVDAGSIANTAKAKGHGAGKTVKATSSATVQAAQTPGISVMKTASVPTVSAVGQRVTYTFTITNTGNVTLHDVGVTDAQAAPSLGSSLGPITCTTGTNGSITLAPGGTDTCSATYTVTQADLNNGSVTDTATAKGTPPNSGPPVTGTSTLTLSVTQISVSKSVSPSGGVVAGSTTPIVYTLTVTNTGTATTTDPIVVTDAAPAGSTLIAGSPACATGGPPTCAVSVGSSGTITWTIPPGVAPGSSYTLTFSVTANESDPTGVITNTGAWTGPSCATTPTCPTNTVTTPVTAAPATAAATVTPANPTTTTTPASTSPSTASAIAFTGAFLSQEWLFGLAALVLGSGLVVIARRRRRNPKQSSN